MLNHWIDSDSNSKFQQEIRFLQTIRHPNIVLFYGAGELKVTLEFLCLFEIVTQYEYNDSTGLTNTVSGDWICSQRLALFDSETRAKRVDMETEDVTVSWCR